MNELNKKKKWRDINGNPTENDDVTHFDENGCLDIREFENDNDTSGQETSDMEVLKSD